MMDAVALPSAFVCSLFPCGCVLSSTENRTGHNSKCLCVYVYAHILSSCDDDFHCSCEPLLVIMALVPFAVLGF